MFFPRRAHYFSYELNREVKEIYWNTGLFYLAINLTYIFEPIFLYSLGFTVVEIMVFFLMVYMAYALFVIPVNKITSKIGYKHAILVASVLQIFYWLALFGIQSERNLFFLAPFLYALQKSFFWPPYNADVALHNVKAQRGREVGVLFSVVELVAIVGPILGGFISYQFGFIALFVTAAVLTLLSVYPLFLSPEIYTHHRFHFKNFWAIMRAYPQNFFGYWGFAEDLMLMSLWPIFIFLVVPEMYAIGAIITFASLIAVVVMLYLGKLVDAFKRFPYLPVSAVFYGFTWLFRSVGAGVANVLTFDVLTRFGKALVNIPLLARTYELAAAKGPDYAIAYAVFFEFSLAMGKVFTALLAIWILTATGSLTNVFIAVGILTMFYAFVKK